LSGRQGVADIERQLEVAPVDEDAQAIVHGLRERAVRLAARHELGDRGELLLLLRGEALEDVDGRFLARVETLLEPLLAALLGRRRAGFRLLGLGLVVATGGTLVHLDLLPRRLRGRGLLRRVDLNILPVAPNRVAHRARVDVGELVRILQAHKLARYPADSFFDGLFAALANRRQLGRKILGGGTGKTRRATR
jgi:hypothetical protein